MNEVEKAHQAFDHTRSNRVLIIGDINIDYVLSVNLDEDQTLDLPPPRLGGTALNAATAFQDQNVFEPILFCRVGKDPEGEFISNLARRMAIRSFISKSASRRSGVCTIIYDVLNKKRILIKNEINNANDYDTSEITRAVSALNLRGTDYIFLVCHVMVRNGMAFTADLIGMLRRQTNARIVLDLVPHNLHRFVEAKNFIHLCKGGFYAVIGEASSVFGVLGKDPPVDPSACGGTNLNDDLNSSWVVLRHGAGHIGVQDVYRRQADGRHELVESLRTGYEALDAHERRGFGDRLTAALFAKHFLPDRAPILHAK